jgi:uncharacterized repeat protein (TIGR04076 family)
MPEMHDVVVKVISQKGRCSAGHRVGDEWVISGKTPEGICLGAFSSLSANLRVLMFGGTFSWSDDPDAVTVTCPDATNPVVFELRRVH